MNPFAECWTSKLCFLLVGVALVVLLGALLYTVCLPRDAVCISCSDGELTVWETCVSYLRIHPLLDPASVLLLLSLAVFLPLWSLPIPTPALALQRWVRAEYEPLSVPKTSVHLLHCVFLF